ncbi:MAG: tRNA guanosine(15) transglycosylase TgtA [Thermoplasmata archaeon]
MFEIKERDGAARIGIFTTPHGDVETPNIMPVVNPNIELISPKRLEKEFGSQMLITNSYIIYRTPELRERALEKGLHSLLDFGRTIMTDSGTFQSHVYGEVDIEPLEILSFQKNIGSDVCTILDRFTEPEDTRGLVEEKVDDTIERAKEASHTYEDTHIALPIQGSLFYDLRERCAHELSMLDGSFYPIGGVVPLLETYRFHELVKVILHSKKGLGPRGPVHLFGAGHPMIYPLAVLLGCDLFDSSSYAKYARRGDLMYPWGTRHISEVEYLGCECPVCSKQSVSELKELPDKERTRKIAEHNLWVSYREIARVKQAVRENSLWEMVENRAGSHPTLIDGVEAIYSADQVIEPYEPKSRRRAFFYTGKWSLQRPGIKRLVKYVKDEYTPPFDGAPSIFFDGSNISKPYSRHLKDELEHLLPECRVNLLVDTPFGMMPLELDETYPLAQSLFPRDMPSPESSGDEFIAWSGPETVESLKKKKGMSLSEMRVRSICDYQFCKGAGDILSQGELTFVKNRKGRIKNVILDGTHILSMRAYDGLFTLKSAGAKLLKEQLDFPVMRVQVHPDSVEFNLQGKNVFAGFVTTAWEKLTPYDEVLVVDPSDSLIAVGRTLLTPDEMYVFKKGLAVRIREGIQ